MPIAAATDRMFSTIALIGMTIERNVTSSSRNAIRKTNPNTYQIRSAIRLVEVDRAGGEAGHADHLAAADARAGPAARRRRAASRPRSVEVSSVPVPASGTSITAISPSGLVSTVTGSWNWSESRAIWRSSLRRPPGSRPRSRFVALDHDVGRELLAREGGLHPVVGLHDLDRARQTVDAGVGGVDVEHRDRQHHQHGARGQGRDERPLQHAVEHPGPGPRLARAPLGPQERHAALVHAVAELRQDRRAARSASRSPRSPPPGSCRWRTR